MEKDLIETVRADKRIKAVHFNPKGEHFFSRQQAVESVGGNLDKIESKSRFDIVGKENDSEEDESQSGSANPLAKADDVIELIKAATTLEALETAFANDSRKKVQAAYEKAKATLESQSGSANPNV